jgi:hypothetical protein
MTGLAFLGGHIPAAMDEAAPEAEQADGGATASRLPPPARPGWDKRQQGGLCSNLSNRRQARPRPDGPDARRRTSRTSRVLARRSRPCSQEQEAQSETRRSGDQVIWMPVADTQAEMDSGRRPSRAPPARKSAAVLPRLVRAVAEARGPKGPGPRRSDQHHKRKVAGARPIGPRLSTATARAAAKNGRDPVGDVAAQGSNNDVAERANTSRPAADRRSNAGATPGAE